VAFYPLKFENIFHEKVWGGQRLKEVLGKPLPEGEKIGESWELSGHPSALSIVKEGVLKGKSITQLVEEDPEGILGSALSKKYSSFPLLYKFIDANDKLSIQVHPDDQYAKEHEGDLGKTEAWYIVDTQPGSTIICGLKEGATPEEIKAGIETNQLEKELQEIEVTAGDVIYISPGTVHAIGAGIVLYEVQEASDVTYRLYDWGRVGLDGKPRDLHINDSLKVINYSDNSTHQMRPKGSLLVTCPYFSIEKYDVERSLDRELKNSFEVVTLIDGEGEIESDGSRVPVAKGETILIPAGLERYTIRNGKNPLTLLISYVPR